MRDYYSEIDKALSRFEQSKYPLHSIDWCANRIDWCWKWKKITHEQMVSLANRVIAINESSIY